jgi:hypothetical protein
MGLEAGAELAFEICHQYYGGGAGPSSERIFTTIRKRILNTIFVDRYGGGQ